ncbi:MAG: hypothetical protein NT178_13825 [Proteobacteria bacterium]|nr:hypothetical protein [Pseudomonadota bacterium]
MLAIKFIINGVSRKAVIDPKKSQFKVIREALKLTVTNEGCSAGCCAHLLSLR